VVGVSASIKTRYGKICCEPSSNVAGYQVVYANISETTSGLKWAQSGWGRERNAGTTTITKYRYAEMQGNTYLVKYDTANAPAEGASHTYKCTLDKSTGKWTYSYDGTAWNTFTDNFWKNQTGTTVQFTGEIFNKEDDMAGTAADKCSFTSCQVQTDGGSFVDAGIAASDVRSDDTNEWGAEFVSATAINIWDKKPNP